MKHLTKVAAILTLSVGSAAKAELICDRCEYVYFGTYLGAFWPGDRATYQNTAIVADLAAQIGPGQGNNRQFDNYWVFDVNQNAPRAAVTISTKAPTALAGPLFAVEIYADTGGAMTCDTRRCVVDFSKIDFFHPLHSVESFGNRLTIRTGELLPGRYFIRIAAGTRATGESAYTGVLAVRRH